jgi:tRNA(Ile)-lysidine synthase
MTDALAAVARAPDTPLLVGFSGGLDSTVLLHALAASPAVRARGLRALHVRHDLNEAAPDWAEHCARTCAGWGLACQVVRVRVELAAGLGLEGAARAARHAAFAEALAPGETLVLAHHRGDQAETVLQRLLRASGSDGLAAMRADRAFAAGRLWRPLLDSPREQLQAYADRHGLRWLEDPANADLRHERNFLRHRVLPSLRERWPGAEAALSRSAALLAEDAGLLSEVADAHLRAAATTDPRTLAIAPLLALSPAWRARVLRTWLAGLGLPPLPGRAHALLDDELLQARADARPQYRWAGQRLECWRGLLHVEAEASCAPAGYACAWNGHARLELPGGASLELRRASDAAGDGRLPGELAPLRVSLRQGGERIRLAGRSHSHALKDCLLQAGLPPWLRRRVPLLHAPDDELLAAGDAVLSERWQRACAQGGLRLHWHHGPGRD